MANRPQCIAIKADGDVCGKRCTGNNTRCGTHLKSIENNGPNTTAVKELQYVHKKQVRELAETFHERMIAEQDAFRIRVLREDMFHEVQQLKARQNHAVAILIREQTAETIRTGVDPDAAARIRREEARRHRNEEMQRRIQENVRRIQAGFGPVANVAAQQHVDAAQDLGRFARDAQNVHTTVAVKQTKDMVQRILKITVPPEYRWNERVCSLTPGDIIMKCKLTPKAAWQMSAKYCQAETIYEFEMGIYGKVLDGVWQYILNSPDKEDLFKCVRQEMEDNIGMCAQGNLTRLCNILAGYMEGIGVQESPAEILGRKLPLLMEIEDETTRLNEAYKLLVETGTPEEEWLSWVEPLIDEGTVRVMSDAAGKSVGFQVV